MAGKGMDQIHLGEEQPDRRVQVSSVIQTLKSEYSQELHDLDNKTMTTFFLGLHGLNRGGEAVT